MTTAKALDGKPHAGDAHRRGSLLYKKQCVTLVTLASAVILAAGVEFAPDGVPFIVAEKTWQPDGLGNHRAVVRVTDTGKPARAVLKWRRVDPEPEIKRVLVKHAATGADAAHVIARNVTAESGEVLFEPTAGAGEYFIYYMPYRERKGSSEGRHQPLWNDYFPADYADALRRSRGDRPTEAEVVRFESRTAFEAWTPMGLRATAAETAALRRAHPENPVIFTEDRANPIHPASWLPAKWAKGVEVRDSFSGIAMKDEYYVWQIALWTPGGAVEGVKVKFSDLVREGGRAVAPRPPDTARSASAPYQMDASRISASLITCFNTEGVNWDGRPMDITLDVPANRVQPLWCGVMIPSNAVPGVYHGTATITAKGMAPRTVALAITVSDQTAHDHGDGELWRHSRLRWLNSRIGEGDTPTKPYKAMMCNREARVVGASEKTLTLAESGLPASIKVNGREVLKRPMRFVVVTEKGEFEVGAGEFKVKSTTEGHVEWTTARSANAPYQVVVKGRMEFDGFVRYVVEMAAEGDVKVRDVRLVTEYTPYASEYLMGAAYMGRDGGKSPQTYSWDWQNGCYDSYWTGGPEAGLHVEFRGGAYHGPLIADRSYSYKPPQAWANDGKGRLEFGGADGMTVVARTGETALSATPRRWEFDLNITPVKPVDLKKQFSPRYFHADPARFDEVAAKAGANIVNIHHAQLLNPVINYPFVVQKELKEYIAAQHAKNRKVKLYYTIRELSNHVAELQALRSLGGEVIAPGNAHGAPWMWEHMGEGYRPAWYVRMWDGSYVDAAFVTSPRSRWINYYLEGLRWMFENYGIDGIYMDDVCFDRTVMKRMRRIIEKYRPGALVDLHSNTGYSKGPMNQYTEFFPYVDRLWFGESFKYDVMSPDTWFVTFSGIPFGQMSEMLQGGGNRWLGTVYGTTRRCYMDFSAGNPSAIWKAWGDFGIEDSRMIGYWDEHPAVTTDSPDVKATAFVRDGRTLLALGNFANEPRSVRLSIDWKRLGLDPAKAKIEARPIQDFQEGRTFAAGEAIPMPAKRGWMLWIQ